MQNDILYKKYDSSKTGIVKFTEELLQRIRDNDPTLTALDLSDNQIGDEGAKSIADALINNHTLTAIDLGHNQIGVEGAKSIADALINNHTLTAIDLRVNQIGVEGTKYIADALINNHTLTYISLSDNQIGVEGTKYIADALINNQKLTSIILSFNQIGDEGAKSIADALINNHTLTYISLSDNQIGDEGAKSIADVLTNNQKLTYITLDLNQIGDEGAKSIADALTNNQKLTYIDLSWNNISGALRQKINALLERNLTLHQQRQAQPQTTALNHSLQTLQSLLIPPHADTEEKAFETKSAPTTAASHAQQLAVTQQTIRDHVQTLIQAPTLQPLTQRLNELTKDLADVKQTQASDQATQQAHQQQTDRYFEQQQNHLQQLTDQQQLIEEQITQLNHALQANTQETDEKQQDLAESVHLLHHQQQWLLAQHQAKQALLDKQREIQKNPNLWAHYRSLQARLTDTLLVCKAIASGQIDSNKASKAGYLFFAGGELDIPIVSPLAKVVAGIENWFTQRRHQNAAHRGSDMAITLFAIDTLAESAAWDITRDYEQQIQHLTPEGVQTFVGCINERLTAGLYQSFMSEQPSLEQWLTALWKVSDKLGRGGLKNQSLETLDPPKAWNDRGVLQKTGIRTTDDEYYSGANRTISRPSKYGYRWGDADLAVQRSLFKDAATAVSFCRTRQYPTPLMDWERHHQTPTATASTTATTASPSTGQQIVALRQEFQANKETTKRLEVQLTQAHNLLAQRGHENQALRSEVQALQIKMQSLMGQAPTADRKNEASIETPTQASSSSSSTHPPGLFKPSSSLPATATPSSPLEVSPPNPAAHPSP